MLSVCTGTRCSTTGTGSRSYVLKSTLASKKPVPQEINKPLKQLVVSPAQSRDYVTLQRPNAQERVSQAPVAPNGPIA